MKITESQLRKMIAESIKEVIDEIGNTPQGQYMLGRLEARKQQQMGKSFDAGMAAQDPVERQRYEDLNTKQKQEKNYISNYAKYQRDIAPYGSDVRNDKYGNYSLNGFVDQYNTPGKNMPK